MERAEFWKTARTASSSSRRVAVPPETTHWLARTARARADLRRAAIHAAASRAMICPSLGGAACASEAATCNPNELLISLSRPDAIV